MSQTYLRGSYLYIQQVHSYSVLSDLFFYFWIPKPSETTHQLIRKTAAHNTVSTCSWENHFVKLIKNSFSLSLSNWVFFAQVVPETERSCTCILFHRCNSRFSDSHSAGSCFLLDCQKRCFKVLKSSDNYIRSKSIILWESKHGHESDKLLPCN